MAASAIDVTRGGDAETLPHLRVSNDLLGNRDALDAAWERDGYWFFRDVLDAAAIDRLRQSFLDVLADVGAIARDDARARFTGTGAERLPAAITALTQRAPYRAFTADPAIAAFFRALLGADPLWLPTPEYRLVAPAAASAQRYDGVHQDGLYNGSMGFRTCWIALSEIDPQVGGLELAEAAHHDDAYLPVAPGARSVARGLVPVEAWRRATYRSGDLLMFDIKTPHTGIANRSDRFRLSLDLRLLPAGADEAVIGDIVDLGAGSISVLHGAEIRRFGFSADAYLRDRDKNRIGISDLADHYGPGDSVILGHRGGIATLLRPMIE